MVCLANPQVFSPSFLNSYRPSLALNYLSKELAFDDLKEADEFLKKLGADIYMEPTPAEAAGTKSNKRKAGFNLPPLEQRFWNAKDAMPFLLAAEEKFKKVDVSFFSRVLAEWKDECMRSFDFFLTS